MATKTTTKTKKGSHVHPDPLPLLDKRRRFHVLVTLEADIEIDEAVLAQGRRSDNPIMKCSMDEDVASHVGYNLVRNGLRLSQIDGYANCPDQGAKVLRMLATDCEVL